MLTTNFDRLTKEVAEHVAADAVVQGHYWHKSSGCFIGCLAHSEDANILADRYGIPTRLTYLAEELFEWLPANEAKAFFATFPAAVGGNDKDLTDVPHQFLAYVIRDLLKNPASYPVEAICLDAVTYIESSIQGEVDHAEGEKILAAAYRVLSANPDESVTGYAYSILWLTWSAIRSVIAASRLEYDESARIAADSLSKALYVGGQEHKRHYADKFLELISAAPYKNTAELEEQNA